MAHLRFLTDFSISSCRLFCLFCIISFFWRRKKTKTLFYWTLEILAIKIILIQQFCPDFTLGSRKKVQIPRGETHFSLFKIVWNLFKCIIILWVKMHWKIKKNGGKLNTALNVCAAALFEAYKLLVSKRVRFLSENFQNTVKRSLKGKLKYKGERSVSYFKVELKFLVVLTVSLCVSHSCKDFCWQWDHSHSQKASST